MQIQIYVRIEAQQHTGHSMLCPYDKQKKGYVLKHFRKVAEHFALVARGGFPAVIFQK
jgi:hypothetical protein